MLSLDDVDAMAEAELESLPGTCRIDRSNSEEDPTGGTSRSYTLDPETIACDVIPNDASSESTSAGGAEQSVSDFVIILPRGTVVNTNDRVELVTLDENGDVDEVLFKYEIVQPGMGDPYETSVELAAKQIS